MLNFRFSWVIPALVLGLASAVLADVQKPHLISSCEPGSGREAVRPKGEGATIVKDAAAASDGEHCVKIESSKTDYRGVEITDGGALAPFKDYLLFKFDIYNPQDEPVQFNVSFADSKTTGYGTRSNKEAIAAAPGKSTIEINLTGLNRSNAKGNTSTDLVNPADLKAVNIFMSPMPKAAVLYVDNLRLEPSGLPTVEGLVAIDFGGKGTPVYPGFTECTDKTLWGGDAKFGWVKPGQTMHCQYPDDLTGDGGSGDAFKVKLPNGKYEVQTCLDPFGTWARFPTFTQRQVKINGKDVLNETMTGAEFLDKVFYANEETEDLPTDDIWNKFILPRNVVRTFPAEVTDGVLSVEVSSPDKHGKWILFLVAYPMEKAAEGRAWFDTLQKQRHDKFVKKIIIRTAAKPADGPAPTAEDTARGFVSFVRHTELDIPVNARPTAGEIGKPIVIESARGQRCGAQLGLLPLADVKGVMVAASDLSGGQGMRIPASAITVKKVRNFFKRSGRTNLLSCEPYILQDFSTLDLSPAITRSVWITLTTPADAPAGNYTGTITITASGGQKAVVPVQLTVFPFALDKVTDITLSVTGTNYAAWGGWFKDLNERWWQGAPLVMNDLADHGMNAVNCGPNAQLIAIKDGKAEIDYTDIDRWLDLAVKHGLDRMADGYGGLDVAGLPRHRGPGGDMLEKNEKESQSRFGISYSQLLSIVYGDFDRHMKEKGFPQRSHHLLDEPRVEWGNIPASAELITLATKACPESLFSGYYTTGQGRDVYFQTMPISISHFDSKALELTKGAGKQLWDYDGNRVRHNIGRWCYSAASAGLKGYLRNGYIFVCSNPYFDMSDDEPSWSVVYPSKKGINGTVGWERTGEGVTDYRYLSTCRRLIEQARANKKAAAQADAAEAYLKQTLGGIDLEKRETAKLDPAGYDQFRHTLAGHMAALQEALK